MTHIAGRRDADLHEDGEHRTTARTTDGRDLERHERRIRAHLADHAEADGDHARAAEIRRVR